LEDLTKLCDDKNEEFKQLEHQDTRMREDLKHAHSQAKKLEKSLAQEQKKVVIHSSPSAYSVLFCSLAVLDPRVGHTMDVLSPFISVILIDSSTGSPVHILMLSTQAVCRTYVTV